MPPLVARRIDSAGWHLGSSLLQSARVNISAVSVIVASFQLDLAFSSSYTVSQPLFHQITTHHGVRHVEA